EDGVNAVDARFLRHEVPSVGTGLFVFNVWQNGASFSAPPNDASGRRTSTVRSGSDMLWLPSDTATEPSQPLWILTVSASAIFLRPCSPFTTVVVMREPPASIPDRFNSAAFFVGRNMAEGRAGRRALHAEDRALPHGETS